MKYISSPSRGIAIYNTKTIISIVKDNNSNNAKESNKLSFPLVRCVFISQRYTVVRHFSLQSSHLAFVSTDGQTFLSSELNLKYKTSASSAAISHGKRRNLFLWTETTKILYLTFVTLYNFLLNSALRFFVLPWCRY